MDENRRYRIKFFSINDGSSIHYLSKSEDLLNNYDPKTDFSFNDLIEYYNLKLYFDNNLFLTAWSEKQKQDYVNISNQVFEQLKNKIIHLTDDNIEKTIAELDYGYYCNFWNLFNRFNPLKNISDSAIDNVLNKDNSQINHILKNKKVVDKYKTVIREFLISYPKSAEIIISNYDKVDFSEDKKPICFPKNFSISDKEFVIQEYLDSEEPNLNYVRLIANSKYSSVLKLSPRTRLNAKKKAKELNDQILENESSFEVGVKVIFDKNQRDPIIFHAEGRVTVASYSETFLGRLQDDVSLFLHFKYLFHYVDHTNLITLISKEGEMDVMERVLIQSKYAYNTGIIFNKKENLSFVQLIMFEEYLKGKSKNLESIINTYVAEINKSIYPNKYTFNIPINSSKYIEKLCVILPRFDYLLKQHNLLAKEGVIDNEVLQIDSKPFGYGEVASLKERKYLYVKNDSLKSILFQFFSDQSHLFYIEKIESHYSNLFELLTLENIKFDDFREYQKDQIQALIEGGYLKINEYDFVVFNNSIRIILFRDLNENGVLSYWNYPNAYKKELDEMLQEGLLKEDKTLLTQKETSYFNYYLNKKEFTNGFDIRNNYMHGTNSFSEQQHKIDYYRMLKVIILTLLKISDDLGIINYEFNE